MAFEELLGQVGVELGVSGNDQALGFGSDAIDLPGPARYAKAARS